MHPRNFRICRNASRICYAILDGEGSELSAAHNKVVGIVNAPEEFQNLQECFKDSFAEVSDIQESGSVST